MTTQETCAVVMMHWYLPLYAFIFSAACCFSQAVFLSDQLEESLVARLEIARSRVWCACYRLSSAPVIAALCRAKRERGVDVQVVVDAGMLQMPAHRHLVSRLARAKIPLIWYRPAKKRGIMHHKYALVDDSVWTGSYNWTRAGASRNRECAVVLQDRMIADYFAHHFALLKRRCMGIVAPLLPARGGVYFLPDHAALVKKALCDDCQQAQRRIVVLLFDFTSNTLLTQLYHAARRGVSILLVVDQRATDTPEKKRWLCQLAGAGSVTIKRYAQKRSLMHCKIAIMDDVMWVGSMNWTRAGMHKNQENVVRITTPTVVQSALRYAHDVEMLCLSNGVAR